MTKKERVVDEVEAKEMISSLVSMGVSHAWRGYGSAVFFELGNLRKGKGKNPKGECSIMIEWSWRFEEGDSIKIGSWSDVDLINRLCPRVVGLKINSVSFYSRLKELEIGFSDSSRFLTFATAEGNPEWAIQNREGHWLSFKNGEFVVLS